MEFTRKLSLQFVLLLFICFSLPSGAEGLKVATVNSSKIIQSYPQAQNLLQDIAKAEADLNKKIQEKRQTLEKAKEQKKTQTELQMLAEQIRLELEPEAKKLEDQSNKKSAEIESKIKSTISEVAKQAKYDLVLVEEAVLYGGTDISDEVLKKLGK
ncbi:MAG: OmpH family outer membrane protein [Candidatus Melainabacteria bacterium]|nr:OmpH family outer membrane protein [Candidatus Melainabacteria bacterium]